METGVMAASKVGDKFLKNQNRPKGEIVEVQKQFRRVLRNVLYWMTGGSLITWWAS